MKKLIELKKKMKGKKPDFIRQDAHKKLRVGKKWRKPRGIDSKVRLNLKGYRRKVKIGYGAPKALKHKDAEGKNIVIVRNNEELEKSSPEDSLFLSSKLGTRKKAELAKKAIELKKGFANLDPKTYLEQVKAKLEKRKADKAKLSKEKEKKKEELEKKKPESIEEKVELTDEEKKKLEKEEKDKILRQEHNM